MQQIHLLLDRYIVNSTIIRDVDYLVSAWTRYRGFRKTKYRLQRRYKVPKLSWCLGLEFPRVCLSSGGHCSPRPSSQAFVPSRFQLQTLNRFTFCGMYTQDIRVWRKYPITPSVCLYWGDFFAFEGVILEYFQPVKIDEKRGNSFT